MLIDYDFKNGIGHSKIVCNTLMLIVNSKLRKTHGEKHRFVFYYKSMEKNDIQ